MSDADGHTTPEQPQAGRAARGAGPAVSRRAILAGSAGLALGAAAAAPVLAQQQGMGGGMAGGMAGHAMGGGAGGVLSNRLYSANPSAPGGADIAENPVNVPPPIGRSEPATVRVDFETIEIEASIDENATYRYWTFNGKVPGPFVRVRVGDTVEVFLKNNEESWFAHNVDFHAATGPGGGAGLSTANPGESRAFKFKALNPGLYVYHCAVSPVAQHISNGMYGLILVEPEGGLPPVDREFYVMQGEIYTEERIGTPGVLNGSFEKLVDERPEFFVFNGHVSSLTEHYPLTARVGETVRIFFGVGGPNFTSSFHVIGEIFDRVYLNGDLLSPPQQSTQSLAVTPGGACIVEFKCDVPGRFVLVDHALSRAEKGLAGYLIVEGEEQPEIFSALEQTEIAPASATEDAAPSGG